MISMPNLPQANQNLFGCISNKFEYIVNPIEVGSIDYMLTFIPRNESVFTFDFVYGLFNYESTVYSKNQDSIISIASELFLESEPLGVFEADVLNRTFERLLKSNPTLTGRK